MSCMQKGRPFQYRPVLGADRIFGFQVRASDSTTDLRAAEEESRMVGSLLRCFVRRGLFRPCMEHLRVVVFPHSEPDSHFIGLFLS